MRPPGAGPPRLRPGGSPGTSWRIPRVAGKRRKGLARRRRPRGGGGPPCACGWGPDALRADLGPAGCGSTESRCLLSVRAPPGSHLPTRRSLPRPRALDLAPSGGAPRRRVSLWPSGVRRLREDSPVGRPVVDAAEPTGHRPHPVNTLMTCDVSSNDQVSTDGVQMPRQAAGSSFGGTARPCVTRPVGDGRCVRPPPCADIRAVDRRG